MMGCYVKRNIFAKERNKKKENNTIFNIKSLQL